MKFRTLLGLALGLLALAGPAWADGGPTIITFACGASSSVVFGVGTAAPPLSTIKTTGASQTFGTAAANCGQAQIRSNAGTAMTDALAAPATVGASWYIYLANADGTASDTVTPASGLINGAASLVIAAGQNALITTDGLNFYMVGGNAGIAAGGTGFPITLCGTSVASGSTNLTLTGCTLAGTTTVNGALTVNPASAAISFTGSGTTTFTVNPPAAGNAIDNVPIGQTTPRPLKGTAVVATASLSAPAAQLLENSKPAIVTVLVQKFIAGHGSYPYTPTPGMVYAVIECVGPGGAGGGVAGGASNSESGGGGSAGGYSRILASAGTVGGSQTVTLGTGGTGVSGAAGNNGTTATSVGTICVGNVGNGGSSTGTAVPPGLGGAAAAAGTGDLALAGPPGFGGSVSSSGTMNAAGSGSGQSDLGQGGRAVGASGAASTGSPGGNCGGGGGGAAENASASAATGGAGGDGCVIITEYIDQ